MSSLAWKCVFYIPELNAKGEPHNIESLEIKYTNEYNLKNTWQKLGHLSSYHVNSHGYGL